MRVAWRNSYVEYVIYAGVTEKYPPWFEEELYDTICLDDSNYTFWVDRSERTMDYYEKQLVEDYSVFLRKPNGDVHVTDWDAFSDLYMAFTFNEFTHSGIAALHEDTIEYIECQAGVLPAGYPAWFYEFFTEAFNFPQDEETIFFFDENSGTLNASRGAIQATAGGEVTIKEHCVFLRNKIGEIRGMTYNNFIRYYDPEPQIGG